MLLSTTKRKCVCGHTHAVQEEDITFNDNGVQKNALIVCPECEALEFLILLTEKENPGEHAELVRALYKKYDTST